MTADARGYLDDPPVDIDLLLQAHRLHEYDGGVHRFPSGGRKPCRGCLAMALLRMPSAPREYLALADAAVNGGAG